MYSGEFGSSEGWKACRDNNLLISGGVSVKTQRVLRSQCIAHQSSLQMLRQRRSLSMSAGDGFPLEGHGSCHGCLAPANDNKLAADAPDFALRVRRRKRKLLLILSIPFAWILPYMLLANYLERSLVALRLLCYTESDLLSVRRPVREDAHSCIRHFFGDRPRPRQLSSTATPTHHSSIDECIFAHDFPTLLHPSLPANAERLLLVRNAPKSLDYRNFIRETWKPLVESNGTMPLLFLIGTNGAPIRQDLTEEAEKFNDILQSDYIDSYGNLTLKMVVAYRYLLHRTQAKQIMVVNDDVIINATGLQNLFASLNIPDDREYMLGKVSRGYPRLFFPWLPWYVSSETYPRSCYPPFVQGSSFVISRRAAQRVVEEICHFPAVNLDDVMMGVLTNCLRIPNIHMEGFDHHDEASRFVVYHYQYSRRSADELSSLFHRVKTLI